MCGRFVEFSDLEHLEQTFPTGKVLCEVAANCNVAPSQQVPAIFAQGGSVMRDKLHWGLVPHWAKDVSVGGYAINARTETVANKPLFRAAFQKRMCLIRLQEAAGSLYKEGGDELAEWAEEQKKHGSSRICGERQW